MPITLTVTGHSEIIASLQNLNDRLDGPEVVQALGQMSSAILEQSTPVGRRGDAGNLQRTMSEMAGPERTGQGWWVGVGNLDGIYPLEAAPKDTIKNFLEMIRGRKVKAKRAAVLRQRRGRRRLVGAGFSPRRVWRRGR